jgi:predicted aspartyl protease
MVLPPCLLQSSARYPRGEPMRRILAVIGAIAATIWGPGSIGAQPRMPSDQLGAIVIPVEVYDGFLIVAKGHIDSLSGLNFLIDTGQTYTSVDRAIADKLGLDVSSSRKASILNLDKKEPARFCRLAEIGMGRFEEEAVPVIVDDLRWLRSDGLHIDAVIGLDLLRKRDSLRVDFREKQIVFDATSPISGRAVPLRQNPWSVTVTIDLEGHHAEMILDTGMRGTVFYRQALENHSVRYIPQERTIGASSGGMVDFTLALMPPTHLGGQNLNREAYLLTKPGASGPSGIAGFLGIAGLRAKIVEFDFTHQELRWSN